MLEHFRRERLVNRTLKRLARQRVLLMKRPGTPWILERAVDLSSRDVLAALHTCHLRGWVEVIVDSVPMAQIDDEMITGGRFEFRHSNPIYRLTEAGWARIQRNHLWLLLTFWVSVAALAASMLAIYIDSFRSSPPAASLPADRERRVDAP